ncbi:uncharacterized protein LOC110717132 [Chenopodium quinoa]|uniref:uncharacterized protein LOC110717132 n=1 Tax=Chenopodium quinoa TaxID=63459 RepID=UPI000B782308|nr:uncharacterized protein LOC110717132 [Chenopodium quinoa]
MGGDFEMNMMGELNFFLGFQMKQTEEGIMIHQQKYIKELIKKYKLENSKTNRTPMGVATKLNEDLSGTYIDQNMYRYMIGSLLYLPASRPDISFSVGLCARSDSFELNGFTNADYAGDLVNRKSTSSMVQFLGPCLIFWGSKKKNTVALSTAETEYVAAIACCSQMLWIMLQVRDFGILFEFVPIYCDNY